MQSRVILITGANTGLGWALTKTLLNENTKIIMACRSLAKARDAIATLPKETYSDELKKNLLPYDLNLANQNSIQECSNKLKKDFPEGINAIVCNAGVYATGCNDRMETDNQFEMHFGTNHLGHYTLCLILLESLRKGAMYSNSDSRIISVSSSLYKKAKYDFNDLQLKKPNAYNPNLAYANSKLANIFFIKSLADRLQKDRTGQPGAGRIKCYSTHPGICYTDLSRYATTNGIKKFAWWVASKIILRSPEQGNTATLQCLNKETKDLETGGYYGNGLTKRSSSRFGVGIKICKQL